MAFVAFSFRDHPLSGLRDIPDNCGRAFPVGQAVMPQGHPRDKFIGLRRIADGNEPAQAFPFQYGWPSLDISSGQGCLPRRRTGIHPDFGTVRRSS